jgi:four helix bundle protein
MALSSYRELVVWQRSIDLVVAVYDLTKRWPDDERFGLIGQSRRSATSIPANFAEGYGREHRGDCLRFLSIARGSLTELETHIIVAVKIQICERDSAADVWSQCQEIGRLLNKHIRSLGGRSRITSNSLDADPASPPEP